MPELPVTGYPVVIVGGGQAGLAIGCPGRGLPGALDAYPGRDDAVASLEDYACHFGLPVELNSGVRRIGRADGGFLVELDDRAYGADDGGGNTLANNCWAGG